MNNNATEDYCSFEVSELLKAKGFNVGCKYYYEVESKERGFHFTHTDEFTNEDIKNGLLKFNSIPMISAPTHALAIKWIRENFGISISANREAYYREVYDKYVYSITWPLDAERKPVASPYFEKSEEAIEAALLHTLKTLIP